MMISAERRSLGKKIRRKNIFRHHAGFEPTTSGLESRPSDHSASQNHNKEAATIHQYGEQLLLASLWYISDLARESRESSHG